MEKLGHVRRVVCIVPVITFNVPCSKIVWFALCMYGTHIQIYALMSSVDETIYTRRQIFYKHFRRLLFESTWVRGAFVLNPDDSRHHLQQHNKYMQPINLTQTDPCTDQQHLFSISFANDARPTSKCQAPLFNELRSDRITYGSVLFSPIVLRGTVQHVGAVSQCTQFKRMRMSPRMLPCMPSSISSNGGDSEFGYI